MSLLTELDAFHLDQCRCDDLDAGIDWPMVWIACPCGAGMARRADGDDRTVEFQVSAGWPALGW